MSFCSRLFRFLLLYLLLAGNNGFAQFSLIESMEEKLLTEDFSTIVRVIDSVRNTRPLHDSMLAHTLRWEGILIAMKDNNDEKGYRILLQSDSLMHDGSMLSRVKVWTDLGSEAYRSKRYTIAKEYLDKAEKHIEKHKLPSGKYLLRILITKGSLLINEGDMEGGLAEFLKAKYEYEQSAYDPGDFKMRVLGSIGFAYDRMNLPEEAIPYHLATFKLGDQNSLLMAQVVSILASDYGKIEKFDSASYWVNKSLSIIKNLYSSTHITNVRPLRVKASLLNRTGKSEEAIEVVETVIDILENARGKYHRSIAQSYYDLGIYNLYGERFKDAHVQFQKAIRSAGKPRPGSPWLTHLRFLTYDGLAQVNLAKTDGAHWLDSAEISLTHAEYWIDSLRHRNRGLKSDQTLFGIARITYGGLVQLMAERHKKDPDPAWLEKAFIFGEKGKAVRLMESRWAQQAPAFSGIPSHITEEGFKLEAQWESIIKTAFRYPDSLELQSEKLELHNKRNQFLRNLKDQYPQYYQLRYKSPTPYRKSVQSLLIPGAWLISFYETSHLIHAFAISADTIIHWESPSIDSLKPKIAKWKQYITNQEAAEVAIFSQQSAMDYASLTSELYDILLGPVIAHKPKHLFIVPDGVLTGLPFGTLSVRKEKQISSRGFQDIPYLIKEVEISYLPAANALLMSRKRKSMMGTYLGFAPTYSSGLTADHNSQLSWGAPA